jgi:hypothetical protein
MKIGFLEVPFNEIGASSLLEKVFFFRQQYFNTSVPGKNYEILSEM